MKTGPSCQGGKHCPRRFTRIELFAGSAVPAAMPLPVLDGAPGKPIAAEFRDRKLRAADPQSGGMIDPRVQQILRRGHSGELAELPVEAGARQSGPPVQFGRGDRSALRPGDPFQALVRPAWAITRR